MKNTTPEVSLKNVFTAARMFEEYKKYLESTTNEEREKNRKERENA